MTQSFDTPLPPPKERRRLRETGSLTRTQLAARLGVSRETVRAWETGRSTPSGRARESYGKLLASLAVGPSGEVTNRQNATPPAHLIVSSGGTGQALPPTAALAPPPADPAPPTPAQAFDALYTFCAPALVRQAFLLTGRRELARESVEQAFQVAWQRWPEVAVDPDPPSWVRATAHDYALSPWHRFRPRYRHPEPPPADARDRALLDVLLTLPPSYRRTLLLYDGVGLGLPETAAETEASTPATASRLLHARAAIAARLPDLAEPSELHRRLAETASTERLHAAKPPTVRIGGERRARFWTRAAIAITVAIIGATALTLHSAPTRYEPPVPPGEAVPGVPPRAAPGTLSAAELALRAKLRAEAANSPGKLVPEAR
ncbi:helix-turn-helix domain-containing protein [Streptomyces sp. NPDC006259]|uniref:helix-turn-helix domain-containing protein n=1 Tax=Streptomyces sp. NPDC006259 TaxID=3364740 RepID=UPI00368EE038